MHASIPEMLRELHVSRLVATTIDRP